MGSFPIVYFGFYPDVVIPVYPRDYFFKDEHKYCLGFDYVDDRIILGAGFMKNHDIQFDRVESKITIVRSECEIGQRLDDSFNFETYYRKHDEDRTWVQTITGESIDGKIWSKI